MSAVVPFAAEYRLRVLRAILANVELDEAEQAALVTVRMLQAIPAKLQQPPRGQSSVRAETGTPAEPIAGTEEGAMALARHERARTPARQPGSHRARLHLFARTEPQRRGHPPTRAGGTINVTGNAHYMAYR
jgi:hypothetical protein